MAYRDKKSSKVKGVLLVWLIRLTYFLPRSVSYGLNRLAGTLNQFFNGKATRVMRRNLELCFPQLDENQINRKLASHLRQNARLTYEFASAWLGDKAVIQQRLLSVNGGALINRAVEHQQPVIVAVPHLGNWEYFWHWLQFNYPLVGMYQPSKFSGVDELVLAARSRFGGELFATDAKGILGLMRSLKQGKVMMILPDQAPRQGAGIYSPFYGQSAYTMTLLHRFIEKTGAQLVFGACLRAREGDGFHIHVEAPQFETRDQTLESFNQSMNLQIESLINQWPEQYQWSYKRFKRQPEGVNLYR